MCGISGYVGHKNASEVVTEALERLSYRGYDSAGICISEDSGLRAIKAAGKIEVLKNLLKKQPLPFTKCAIGHTRWATHGAVNDRNSHPHGTKSVMLVHNGIIENYLLIKEKLTAFGYTFKSETDTECAALLLDYNYSKLRDPISALRKTADKLQGSFAFAVMFADIKDTVFALRRESPLLIGIDGCETHIASDIPAFLPFTKKYFRLEDGEIAKITPLGVKVYGKSGDEIVKTTESASFDEASTQKNGFKHYMRKEIDEECDIVTRLIDIYTSKNGAVNFPELDENKLKGVKKITVVGCGTAYHAGLYLKFVLELVGGIEVDCEIASELRYSKKKIGKDDLLIFISQSGETADTLSCLRMAKNVGAYTVGIVNVKGSAIASEADAVIYTHAGVEIAVASTKAYTAQCTVCALFSVYVSQISGGVSENDAKKHIDEIKKLPTLINTAIKSEELIYEAAKEIKNASNLFFIGRQSDYIAALEGSLKLKEISYIHSECYPAGELKHGTISLITEGTPVIVLMCEKRMRAKTLSNLKEVSARGAKTIVVCPLDTDVASVADVVIGVPDTESLVAPIALGTTLQLLSYHTATLRGTDVDQPRNLAKSVTVE